MDKSLKFWVATIIILVIILFTLLLLQGCEQLQEKTTTIVNNPPSIKTDHKLTITYINVGQGLSVLITTPDNQHILYDCGEENSGSLKYLQKQNIKKLQALIISHPHSDHIGNCDKIIQAIPITTIYDNGLTHSSTQYKQYSDLLTNENHQKVRTDSTINIDPNIQTRLIVPYDNPQGENTNTNDNTVLLKIEYGSTSFLLTGDCEHECEQDILLDNINTDVLQIGHHGSRTSTTNKFLLATTPQVTIISVGQNNRYNHPHNETLTKLTNTQLYRTDIDGTITLQSDAQKITLKK